MIACASAEKSTLHINNSVNKIKKKIVDTVPEIFFLTQSFLKLKLKREVTGYLECRQGEKSKLKLYRV